MAWPQARSAPHSPCAAIATDVLSISSSAHVPTGDIKKLRRALLYPTVGYCFNVFLN